MRGWRRRLLPGTLLSILAGPAAAGVAELPATETAVTFPTSTAEFPGIDYGRSADPKDDRHTKTSWTIVEETGNCCETLLTTTSGGRLLDFGGTYIHFTDDRGKTWRRVTPLLPLVNGEGAVVVAPNGDVLGVGWDPYSGDHLQFYKLTAATGRWTYTEMPVHTPFYDREWITVVPGPITVGGATHPYVSLVKGGYPSKEAWFYSTDGVNYTAVTSKFAEVLLSGAATRGPLPTTAHPANDWTQANTGGRTTALGGGRALAAPDADSRWALLAPDFTWSAFTFADGSAPSGLLQVDSAGRVHNVVTPSDGGSFVYRISADGGRTWRETVVVLPKGETVEEMDFRANRAAGVAAVAMRAQDRRSGRDRDVVYKLDIQGPGALLQRRYEVGLGDADATGGLGNDVRFDFESVTIFPDGRVAVSFLDSTTNGQPAVAIEGLTRLGHKVRPEPTVPPVLGEVYAAFTFEGGPGDWTSDVPPWTNEQPGANGEADDPAGHSMVFEGPDQYVNMIDSALTSPPVGTAAGLAVLEFRLKLDLEPGYDYLHVEWTANGTDWASLAQLTGRNAAYPAWDKVTLGFESPGVPVRVRFRVVTDPLCSALDGAALCSPPPTGARVDEVVVGKQAP